MIKGDLNKWRDTLNLLIEVVNIVKMSVLPEVIQRFNAVPNKDLKRDFPGGAVVKNPPANAGDTSPGLGRFHTPRSN